MFDIEVRKMRAQGKKPIPETAPITQRSNLDESLATKFNKHNESLGLIFKESNYKDFKALYELVVRRLKKQGYPDPIQGFLLNVEYIEFLIEKIINPVIQKTLQEKYVELYYKAKKTPAENALSYNVFRAMLMNMAEDFPVLDDACRKELGMMENLGFEIVAEDQTEEQAEQIRSEKASRKAEILKKSK